MNHYTLADMTPGLTESFTVTVTAEMMEQFCAITGDVSPIHMDEDYARGRGYPGRVVYGMLGKGTNFFGYHAGTAKFFFGAVKHQGLIHIHKFGNVFSHLACIVRNKQNSYAVLAV